MMFSVTYDLRDMKDNEVYSDIQGYGFLPLTPNKNGRYPQDKFINEAGWLPHLTWHEDEESLGESSHANNLPQRFRVKVPNKGTYRVIIQIEGGERGVSGLDVYTGRRQKVGHQLEIKPMEVLVFKFAVHVNDYIAIVGEEPRLDDSIYVTFMGPRIQIKTIAIEETYIPTLFIGGDSIVCDNEGYYPYNSSRNGGAWGQFLPSFLDNIAVDNHAHGGMTTECFRTDGHYDLIMNRLLPGDICLLQFGHNDQKRRHLSAFGGYRTNLRRYIREIREKGGIPILVTSLSRIPQQDKENYFDLLLEHAQACLWVGDELQVEVIDLHKLSFRLWCQMSKDELENYFNDAAHTNDNGALLVASFIANEIKSKAINPLVEYLKKDEIKLEMACEARQPSMSGSKIELPEMPILSTDLPQLPYVDCRELSREQEIGLKKAMSKGFLDPCVKFFHPNETLPRGQFLFLFFKAVRLSPKRYYQGFYDDISRYEWDAAYIQLALDEELIDLNTTPNHLFRPDEAITCGECLNFIIRYLKAPLERNIDSDQCEAIALSLGLLWRGYEREKKLNRVDCVLTIVAMLSQTYF